ncbi:MAG: DnaA/Hda family protein [Alphaproteobacteria bacterium]
MSAEQLALDLGQRPALGHEDFLVAPSNAEAVAWLDRWPDWPSRVLAIHGPPGCGKSHLAHVWRAVSGAPIVAASALAADDAEALAGAARGLVVEATGQGFDEVALLHLYNLLAERHGSLLLTGREPPARWRLRLPDLRSRLNTAPAIAIHPPDDGLLAAVLVKLFADRQLRVEPGVVSYLVGRMERSFEAARSLVAALDRVALARRRRITIALARELLARPGPSH